MAATAPSRSDRSTAPGAAKGDAAGGDPGLGPRDALLHRAFADEEGARDLPHREAGNDPERQGDLLRRR